MGYKKLYEEWKKKQKSFGYTDPSEHSEDQFKNWVADQIDYMW